MPKDLVLPSGGSGVTDGWNVCVSVDISAGSTGGWVEGWGVITPQHGGFMKELTLQLCLPDGGAVAGHAGDAAGAASGGGQVV